MNHAGMMRHPEGDETSTRPSTRAMWMEKGEKLTTFPVYAPSTDGVSVRTLSH
jgi:hypothetical protein